MPKTIENQRVYDETTVDPNDEEVGVFEKPFKGNRSQLVGPFKAAVDMKNWRAPGEQNK